LAAVTSKAQATSMSRNVVAAEVGMHQPPAGSSFAWLPVESEALDEGGGAIACPDQADAKR
jgi:hypothetical protein